MIAAVLSHPMNGSLSFVQSMSSWIIALTLVGSFLLGCSGEEGDGDPAPSPVWPEGDLVAVAMTDDDRAVVVSMSGRIYWSPDAGHSWQSAQVPAVGALRAISMAVGDAGADGQAGWVVGDGVILRTDDGGQRWRRQRLPGPSASMRLVGVSAMDGAHALAIGRSGIVLRTRDRGGVWAQAMAPPDARASSSIRKSGIFCLSAPMRRCWSTGLGLERTDDDGASWKFQVPQDFASMRPIDFDLGEVELTGADHVRLRQFVAANRHREDLDWTIEPSISPGELESIGRRRDPSALFELIAARLQEVRNAIEEGGVSPDHVFVLGAPPWDYEDYLDDDAGFLDRYWNERSAANSNMKIRVRDRLLLDSVWVDAEAGAGLAVGRLGAVLRSDDGGGHWQTVSRPTPHDLHAVGVGRRRSVAVGAQGGLWTSDDAGRHWESPSAEFENRHFDSLRAISFSPSGQTGIAVGEQGRILRSSDGGESWLLLGPSQS